MTIVLISLIYAYVGVDIRALKRRKAAAKWDAAAYVTCTFKAKSDPG